MTQKNEKKVESTTKEETVSIFKTTYYYYRFWIRNILNEGKVVGFRFAKEGTNWDGNISVPKSQESLAIKVLNEYKTTNAETVEMWWDKNRKQ